MPRVATKKPAKTSSRNASKKVPETTQVAVVNSNPKLSVLLKFASVADSTNPSFPAGDECTICVQHFYDPSSYDEKGDEVEASEVDGVEQRKAVVLLNCGHPLHLNCALKFLGDEDFMRCPQCNVVMGVRTGNQPDGCTMVIDLIPNPLPGFDDLRTIRITYSFQSNVGTQGTKHPNPGQMYTVRNFPRTAYLPYDADGILICEMLKIAFMRRLVFTVGFSVTDGVNDTVTWASIHHKTRWMGEYGYPDPNYFANVTGELACVGVTKDAVESETNTRVPWNLVVLPGGVCYKA